MFKNLFFLFLALFFTPGFSAEDIDGFWKTVNEDGKAQCILGIYEYEDIRYGRIIATFDDDGNKIEDSIYNPKKRAPGVVGDPYYCGLDIIWDLVPKGDRYKGKILDPQKGNIYNSELWIDDGDLIVRGKLLFFGRNYRWYEVTKEDLPEGFKMPNLNEFVPVIPVVK